MSNMDLTLQGYKTEEDISIFLLAGFWEQNGDYDDPSGQLLL